jgi:two-component system, LytTR family, response regulator
MTWHCIIIDDDDLAIRLLEDYIKIFANITVAKTFENALLANDYLQKNKIDIIFVDIQMPFMTGLQFVAQLNQKAAIIITTSYPDYALDGYNLQVIDYLLKPYLPERFIQAIEKAIAFCDYQNLKEGNDANYLFVKSNHKMVKVMHEDIFYIEGLKQYLKIHLADKFIVILDSMKNMQQLLPSNLFIRIQKSYIIHKSKIEHYDTTGVKIKGIVLPIGKTYRENFEKEFL